MGISPGWREDPGTQPAMGSRKTLANYMKCSANQVVLLVYPETQGVEGLDFFSP